MIHSDHQPGVICKNTENDHVDFDWPNPICAGALQRRQEMDMDRRAHLWPQPRRRRGQAGAQTRMSAWRWVSSTSASPKPARQDRERKPGPQPLPGRSGTSTGMPRGCEVLLSISLTPRGWDSVRLGDPAVQHTEARGSKRARGKRRPGNCRGDAPPRKSRKGPQARRANGGLFSLSRGEETTSTNWSRASRLGSRPNSLRPPAKYSF